MCPNHSIINSNAIVSYFITCSQIICAKCVQSNHSKHQLKSLMYYHFRVIQSRPNQSPFNEFCIERLNKQDIYYNSLIEQTESTINNLLQLKKDLNQQCNKQSNQ